MSISNENDPLASAVHTPEAIPHSGVHHDERPVEEFDTSLQDAYDQGLVHPTPETPSRFAHSLDQDPKKSSKTRLLIGAGALAAVVAGGVGFMAGNSGGSDKPKPEKTTAPAAKTPERVVVSNICDIFSRQMVEDALQIEAKDVSTRTCGSSVQTGVVAEIDWLTSSGDYITAGVLDNTVVGNQSVRGTDGSLRGFGNFDDYISLQANRRFTITTPDNHHYPAAHNATSVRVLAGEYMLNITIGTGNGGAAPIITDQTEPRYLQLAEQLATQVFTWQADAPE